MNRSELPKTTRAPWVPVVMSGVRESKTTQEMKMASKKGKSMGKKGMGHEMPESKAHERREESKGKKGKSAKC